MSGGYPDGCTQADHDKAWGDGDVSRAEIAERLREQSYVEAQNNGQLFKDWLAENPESAIDAACALVYFPPPKGADGGWRKYDDRRYDAEERQENAREELFADFSAWYVNWAFEYTTLPEDVAAEILEERRDEYEDRDLEQRIEADEVASLREHGAPDEDRT